MEARDEDRDSREREYRQIGFCLGARSTAKSCPIRTLKIFITFKKTPGSHPR